MSIQHLFGGWPFLDQDFDRKRLLAAVVAMRMEKSRCAKIDMGLGRDIKRHLIPSVAQRILTFGSAPPRISYRALDEAEFEEVSSSILHVRSTCPLISPYWSLPVSFHILLDGEKISCSAYHYPQQIFLSERALISRQECCEQLIHELAHLWMYLVEEVSPLAMSNDAEAKYTLPSGTRGKTPSEVLGASHVAAVLCRWYAISTDPRGRERFDYLLKYKERCLHLPELPNSLTTAGLELLARLRADVVPMHNLGPSLEAVHH